MKISTPHQPISIIRRLLRTNHFMNKIYTRLLVGLLFVLGTVGANAQIAVTVTGNTNTTPNLAASYASLALALTDLNLVTAMTGPVVLTCNAGDAETAPPTGLTIGSATLNLVLSVTNTVTINKSGGTVTLNAGVGTATPAIAAQDGILKIVGADYITIDGLTFTDANAANPATMEFAIGLFKLSLSDGAQNNTIQNCIITLNRINNAPGGGPSVDGSRGINVVNATDVLQTTALTPTTAAGTNSNNKFYANTIQNCNYGIALNGFAALTPFATGDTGNDIGGVALTTGNTILNYGGAAAATNPAAGIRANNQWGINISYNTVNNNNGAGVNHATTLRGIYAQAGTSASATINNNTVSINSGATTSACTAIENVIGSTAASNTITINSNTISGSYATATTGVWSGIVNTATATTVNINSNTMTGFTLAGTGTHVMIETGSPVTVTANSNSITSITRTGVSGSWRGIKTTSPTNLTVNGNTIDGLSWTTVASTGSIDGIYGFSSAVNVTANNNIIRNLSTPTTGTITGINEFGVSGLKTFQNNQIYNFTTTAGGAGGASFRGISESTGSTNDISGNQIYSLNSIGTTGGTGGTIVGITFSSGTTNNIYKNKIYDLSSTSTNPTVSGITSSGGTTNNIYNNLIGDLKATAANAAIPLVGINVSGGTTVNLRFNTVRLNGTSSGALFGSSAVSASTTPTLEMRNNIFVNLSTPAGATGFSSAYRRSTITLTSYAAASNNNLFYAGTPGVNNLIFYDGTNSDQTLAAYKTRVASRDAGSVTENPPFLSLVGANATFLHIDPTIATQVESGAATIGGITDDFDGDVRNVSTPDIGADEGTFILADVTAPTITYTPLPFTCDGSVNRTLTTTITDASGVPTAGIGLPVLYWRINAGAWTPATATFVSGSTYTFSFGIGAIAGDVVQYYIVAQDLASTPNVGAFPSAGAAGFTIDPPAAATPPTTPSSYTINSSLSGTYTVGAAGTYTTLTAAIAAYNTSCLTGPVLFSLIDAAYVTTSDTVRVNADASSVNTLTIKPTLPGTTITGNTAATAAAVLVLLGADYVTIDGSISATANTVCPLVAASRDLTISNSGTSTSSAVVWFATSVADGATNNRVINCNLAGNSNTTTLFGVGSGSATIGTTSLGTGNNNNQFVNNNISRTQYGIYSQGASLANKNSGTVINQNLVNTATPNNVQFNAIWAGFESGIQISGNNITGLTTANDITAIAVGLTPTAITTTVTTGNEVTGASITNNVIGTVVSTSATGFSATGIAIASAATGTNLIANNVIYGVTAPSTSGDLAAGIYVGGGAATTQVYFNSVSMSGTRGTATYSSYALAINGTTPTVDIRNNILVNTQTSTGAGQSYAIGLAYTSAVGNYANLTSNYNDLYSSGTSAALSKVGSLSQGTGTNLTTLNAWVTETGRDPNSISADPLFNSATNLQPQPGSPVVGAAVPGTGITTDITCFTRSVTTPTIGAYEVAADITGPVITYTTLFNSLCLTDRTLSPVTITDAGSGVNITAGTRPRLYYKKTTNANTFVDNTNATNGWKFVEATGAGGSPFSFTTDYSLLSGGLPVAGDIIQYLVVAQDLAATPNVAINSGIFNVAPLSVALTAAAFPITGTINQYTLVSGGLNADVTIGAAGTYPTLTGVGGLFQAINSAGLLNNITARILDATITEDGTNSLNAVNYGCAGSYTLIIKPDVGITTVLSGTGATALINLDGADNITFDGSNNATSSKNMTIRNLSTTGSTFRFINDATNNTVKNTIIEGAVTSTTTGIVLFSTSTGTLGNSNNAITNNDIRDRSDVTAVFANAVYSGGTTSAPNASGTISGNNIFNFNTGAINLSATGIGNNWQLNNNNIYNAQATASAVTQNGILITGGTGHTVSGNFVGGNTAGATGTWTNSGNVIVAGISITGGVANIDNNTVANITTSNTGTTARIRGIANTSGGANGIVINGNTIFNLSSFGSIASYTGGSQPVIGIHTFPGTTWFTSNVTNNLIHDLVAENTTALTSTNMAVGIVLTNWAGGCYKNTIYNIKNKSTGITAGQPPIAAGIYARFFDSGYVYNNMISLGDGESNNVQYNGIQVVGAGTVGNDQHYYFNSIRISGTATGTFSSHGFVRGDNSVTSPSHPVDLKDNILSMARTGGGSVNYAIANQGTGAAVDWISDFNDLYNSTSANIGFWNATGYDFINWQSTSAGDVNSLSILPNFVSINDLHLVAATNCGLNGYGTPIAGITTDYDNQTRDVTTPDMGADEFTATYSGTLAGVAGVGVCENKTVSLAGTTYATGVCDLIARLLPSGADPVAGKVNVCVTLDATQQYFNGEPYVQRHFDLEPTTSNQTTTSATITLYFTDAEFALYNTNNPVRPPLPTVAGGANADPFRANVKVTQFHGTATTSPSTPGNYTGVRVLLLPTLANVFWNGTYWSVTFDVTGFSGFYIHTSNFNVPLPISINYFTGTKQGTNHLLNWKVTCNSTPRVTMTLERSADSRNFTGINIITADAVRCNQPFDYTDTNPLKGMNYYRLKMVDVDGKISYSSMVALLNAVKGFDIVSIAPNPVVTDNFKLNVASAQAGKMDIAIFDMQGRLVNRQTIALIAGFNSMPVNVANLSSGTYTIKGIMTDDQSKVMRFVKQ